MVEDESLKVTAILAICVTLKLDPSCMEVQLIGSMSITSRTHTPVCSFFSSARKYPSSTEFWVEPVSKIDSTRARPIQQNAREL